MYQPDHHREDRLEVLHDLVQTHPFGLLISTGVEGIEANGLPFLLQRAQGPFGQLQAHIARANAQWRALDGQQVLVVFQGPQTYISPSHYQTKAETGKVVPTWNYVMVQARGIARVLPEMDWIETQITALTATHEARLAHPWAVSDAPRPYVEAQMRGILGIQIDITRLEGKWKVSQNRVEADRRGVAEGLAVENPEMAGLVKRHGQV